MRLTTYPHGKYEIFHVASQEKSTRISQAVEGIGTEKLDRVLNIWVPELAEL